MSHAPFGERYFATRECIAGVLRGISALARETGTELSDLPAEQSDGGLGDPFLFLVCGEVNSGKSTLLNGLFGHSFCPASPLPETARICWYSHGPKPCDIANGALAEERQRPHPFLKNFHVVDTPGTNVFGDSHLEILTRIFPHADLILFVFSIANPWNSATWNIISELSPESLDRTVLVLQQSDQRTPGDIDIILGHIADLAKKRLGRELPVFAVSGKLAWEARSSPEALPSQLQASGFPLLENYISKQICGSESRRRALETWHAQALSALRDVENRIEEQSRAFNQQTRFLDAVEREIHEIRESIVARLPSHLAAVAEVFDSQAVRVSRILRHHLHPLRSFWRIIAGDTTSRTIEAVFLLHLKRAVLDVAEKDGDEVVSACRSHWQELGARVHEEMGIDLPTAVPIDQPLANAREQFVSRLGLAATRGIGNLKVRTRLDKEIHRRNGALRSFAIATLLFLIGGSTCGALHIAWLPVILCTIAAIFAIAGMVIATLSSRVITRHFLRHLLETCGAFASTLRHDYEDALRIFFRDYAESLDVLPTSLAREKLAIEPRLKRWQRLFLTLKAIEQDL